MLISRKELNILLDDPDMVDTPLLVLANKVDIQPHMKELEIIKGLNLDYVMDRHWILIPISALYGTNFSQVVEWLLNRPAKPSIKKRY